MADGRFSSTPGFGSAAGTGASTAAGNLGATSTAGAASKSGTAAGAGATPGVGAASAVSTVTGPGTSPRVDDPLHGLGGAAGTIPAGGPEHGNDAAKAAEARKWDLEQLATIGDFKMEGLVWVLSCNNEQTLALQSLITTMAPKLTVAAGPYAPQMATAIGVSLTYIEVMNRIGGNNGVDINGVIGVSGLVVTPRLGKLFGTLLTASRLGVTGRVISEFIANAAASSPALASSLQLSGIAVVIRTINAGTPLGWALAAAAGFVVRLFEPEPDINDHGAVLAKAGQIGEWESFTIGGCGIGDRVSILSWLGHFSAQGGGGAGVYANRPAVGEWEQFRIIDNHDGTYSFQTFNGHYLSAEMGGGRELQANRTQIGEWEKFSVINLPNCQKAIRARNGQFVGVQA